MRLRVLNVSYPAAPVGPDSVGGAEQVLSHLDRALVEQGHQSLVIAPRGSRCAGELIGISAPRGQLTPERRRELQKECSARIEEVLRARKVDLIHMHGIDFHSYLPSWRGRAPGSVPVLVTLHLPPDWYPPEVFGLSRPRTYLHCVSASQHRSCPRGAAALLSEIGNGVAIESLQGREGRLRYRRSFVGFLGRICPEKGVHLAVDAASGAGRPLLIGGQVFPYAEHERYFLEQVAPRLDRWRRFVGPISFRRKRRFLSRAICLLIPSLAAEASSLVAMEALACGTPVIAFRAGALSEIIEHGKTGFLVDSVEGMSQAIRNAGDIDPMACFQAARERFSASRMATEYLDRYRELVRAA